MKNTRLELSPLIVSAFAPGPTMLTFLLMTSSPVFSVIVPVTEKLMVSPSAASASALRNEPSPLSLLFDTVIVNADTRAGPSKATTAMMAKARRRVAGN
jgi:hypothetical protein